MFLALGVLVFAPACQTKAPTTAQQTMPKTAAPLSTAAPPTTAPGSAPARDVLSQDLDRSNRAGYLKDAFFD